MLDTGALAKEESCSMAECTCTGTETMLTKTVRERWGRRKGGGWGLGQEESKGTKWKHQNNMLDAGALAKVRELLSG